MQEKQLIPSIERRLGSLQEFSRRLKLEADKDKSKKLKPVITLSREFGCEGYPLAEYLQKQLEQKTGETWLLMDKALLEEVARNNNISETVLLGLGERSRFLDEILSTFSSRWRSEKDHFKVMYRHIMALANEGNVILVGRGSAFITQSMDNCHHFRLNASHLFKINSISRRLNITAEEAEEVIARRQKQRDNFIRDFLDRDAKDLSVYHVIFNNDLNTVEKMGDTIIHYVLNT